MKRLIILFCVTLICVKTFAPAYKYLPVLKAEGVNPYESLWLAICKVESGNNPIAYNIKEGAIGVAQVRQCRVDHYNDLTGKNYALNQMYDTLKAKEVFMYFCQGRDFEAIAKSWNGSGKQTEVYWNKVKAQL
jgi:hypothetical protein